MKKEKTEKQKTTQKENLSEKQRAELVNSFTSMTQMWAWEESKRKS